MGVCWASGWENFVALLKQMVRLIYKTRMQASSHESRRE